MRKPFCAAILALGVLASPSFAAEKTVVLIVENMYCAACPHIVKESLSAVSGVSKVEVSYEAKTAIVTFDDTLVEIDALTKATTEAGYPSAPKS